MHSEMINLMHRILDGDSPAPERARLEAHLAGCAECSRAWELLRSAHATLAEAVPVSPPDYLRAAITLRLAREMGVVRSASPMPGLWMGPVPWERPRLAAAITLLTLVPAAALAGAVGLLAWQAGSGGPGAVLPVLRIGGGWEGLNRSLSGVLALLDWGIAWTTLLGAFARTGVAVAGTGPLVLAVVLSLGALAMWAHLLTPRAAEARLG